MPFRKSPPRGGTPASISSCRPTMPRSFVSTGRAPASSNPTRRTCAGNEPKRAGLGSWPLREALPRLAPDLPTLLGPQRPGEWARLAELCRHLAAFDQERRDRGGVTLQDLCPLPGIESRAFTGRQPSLHALAGHFENLRMVPQALGDGAVVRDAPFLCESV